MPQKIDVIVEQLVEWESVGETDVPGENPPQCHSVHKKSQHCLIWDRTRAVEVGSRRLTACATARPRECQTIAVRALALHRPLQWHGSPNICETLNWSSLSLTTHPPWPTLLTPRRHQHDLHDSNCVASSPWRSHKANLLRSQGRSRPTRLRDLCLTGNWGLR
jgi:hypothetical protein